jgi:hypothetical protein
MEFTYLAFGIVVGRVADIATLANTGGSLGLLSGWTRLFLMNFILQTDDA